MDALVQRAAKANRVAHLKIDIGFSSSDARKCKGNKKNLSIKIKVII